MRRFAWVLVCGAVAVLPAVPADSTSVGTETAVARVVVFGPGGPHRVTFHSTLAGGSLVGQWNTAVEQLFTLFDRNGDGQLDATERAPLVSGGRRRAAAAGADSELVGRFTFDDKTPVDRQRFTDALTAAGFGPIHVRTVAGRPDSAELTTALFKELDTDGDKRLTPAELAAARTRLARLDANEDEWVTANELLNRSLTNRQVVPVAGMTAENPVTTPNVVVLTGTDSAGVKQLLAARTKRQQPTLTRAEFGSDEDRFHTWDRDGNGRLDSDELLGFLRQPADWTVHTTLGRKNEPAVVQPMGLKSLGGVRFSVAGPGPNPKAETDQFIEQLRSAFKTVAGPSSVEKKSLKEQPLLAGVFDVADRNADGILTSVELDTLISILDSLSVCRCEVVILDQGRGLFELVDANGDGRLSPRELAGLPKVADRYLVNGSLGRDDVPTLYPVQTNPAGFRLFTSLRGAVPVMTTSEPAPVVVGPKWFTAMDVNGDGDVSKREFLGPLELFVSLDSDHDGLLSAAEASRAK